MNDVPVAPAKIEPTSVYLAWEKLRERRFSVTPEDIAQYLEAPLQTIHAHLYELEARRWVRRIGNTESMTIRKWGEDF